MNPIIIAGNHNDQKLMVNKDRVSPAGQPLSGLMCTAKNMLGNQNYQGSLSKRNEIFRQI